MRRHFDRPLSKLTPRGDRDIILGAKRLLMLRVQFGVESYLYFSFKFGVTYYSINIVTILRLN